MILRFFHTNFLISFNFFSSEGGYWSILREEWVEECVEDWVEEPMCNGDNYQTLGKQRVKQTCLVFEILVQSVPKKSLT